MPDPVGTRSAVPEPAPREPPDPGAGSPCPASVKPAPPPVAQPSGTRTLVERYGVGTPGGLVGFTSKPANWYAEKAVAELDCLTLPPAQALRAAEWGYMPSGGLAQKMLDHFLSGSSAPVRIDLNAELQRNPQLHEYVASRIESEVAERVANGDSPVDIGGHLGTAKRLWAERCRQGPATGAWRHVLRVSGGRKFSGRRTRGPVERLGSLFLESLG